MTRHLAILGTVAALLTPACGGSGGGAVVDLTVIVPFSVAFGEMEGDVPEQTAPGDMAFDLRSEADYLRLRERLRCAGVDVDASILEIVELLAPGDSTALTFQVDVAAWQSPVWTPLLEFNGLVADGEAIGLNDGRVSLSAEGVDLLGALALDAAPAFELRVTGEVPAWLSNLDVELTLELIFSSRPAHCPAPAV